MDAEHFVNRAAELEMLERMLDGGRQIALLHGPGGVGKSALLREFARRAARRGRSIHWVEGRELDPGPGAFDDLLSTVRAAGRALIVIDTFERMEALAGYLRGVILPSLPEETLVVIASRGAPGREWRERGWERVVVELRVDGLTDEHALEVLWSHGLRSTPTARRILGWAGGSPLALTLAAQLAQHADGWAGDPGAPDVVRAIVARLADPEVEPQHTLTLWVAAIARVTTLELLGDALPECDPAGELRWLAARTFTEPLGDGIVPHELVASALRQELLEREPLRERELRRRICDHLYERASRGNLLLTIDLAHLSLSPEIRWGFAWQPATRFRLDDLRPGDAEQIRARLSGTWYEPLLAGTERFIEQAPEHITTVRDGHDRLRGYTIALSPPDAPDFCAEDPLLGPRLKHARQLPDPGKAVLWRDAVDLAAEFDPAVIAMLGMAGVLKAAHGNPRFAYLPINPHLPGAVQFSQALNGQRLEGLDAQVGKARVECHLVDYGPEGLLGAQRDLIYHELGLARPPSRAPSPTLTAAVREVLRNLDRPQVLAGSELATGTSLAERAASVRTLIDEALEQAYSDSAGEQLTRKALIVGYVKPAPSHELAAKQLSLSRAAYFRRLKRGTEQLAEYIAAKRASSSGS
ncbi:MAG: AAA family ATPase [Solirubrobacteraceae bacterium]